MLSQGDVAVGRINRNDVAKLLVAMLRDPSSSGKTIEALAVPGLPVPSSYGAQLSKLQKDFSGLPDRSALDATYAVMQQLLPGETLAPEKLAAGQTYEQFDKNEQGALGQRGEESVPLIAT